jgi:hypothetical protein
MKIYSLKNPKTIQELRSTSAIKTDYNLLETTRGLKIIVRAKRVNLPTSWNDRFRTKQRSWKAQRLTQYK